MEYNNSLVFAKKMDEQDDLKDYRSRFHIPIQKNGQDHIYLCGNSLGLQPVTTKIAIQQELEDWKNMGVEGHFHAKNPWMPYHEFLTDAMAKVVGGKPEEVVVMNTLTVNLHLMLVSFYRPAGTKNKIVIEADAFPSDRYAVESQIRFHGLDPQDCLVELKARDGEVCIRMEDIQSLIEEQGDQIALIMLGNTNYYTGQFFDMKTIARWGHMHGCMVGFDCAHGAGNVSLELHDSGCDFAVWCNYKYLNAGPGSVGGAFVHERHLKDRNLPRLEGWWGHDKATRFMMRDAFDPTPTVEAWQLSNPPILSMVAVWSSLKIFDEVGMDRLRKKSIALTGFLEYLVNSLGEDIVDIITPSDKEERGSQLSIRVRSANKELFNTITEKGVIADWREPDVIRVAPVPLYNSYVEVFHFYEVLKEAIEIQFK